MKYEQRRQLEAINVFIREDVEWLSDDICTMETAMREFACKFELREQLEIIRAILHDVEEVKTKVYALKTAIQNSSTGLELKQLMNALNEFKDFYEKMNSKLDDLEDTVNKLVNKFEIPYGKLKGAYDFASSLCSQVFTRKFSKYLLDYLAEKACESKIKNPFGIILEYFRIEQDKPIYLFYSEDDFGESVLEKSNIDKRQYEILYEKYREIERQVADKYNNEDVMVRYDGKLFLLSLTEEALTGYDYDDLYEETREFVYGVTKGFCLEFLGDQIIDILFYMKRRHSLLFCYDIRCLVFFMKRC